MKYIKLFEIHNSEEDIHKICKQYNITNYTINADMSIDVNGSVAINNIKAKIIPLNFNIVNGDFFCIHNELTSLKGAPKEVYGTFDCSNNKLTSLEYCPIIITQYLLCHSNKLTSLVGCPEDVDSINCAMNNLLTLEGGPIDVNKIYNCSNNKLTSLVGCPKKVQMFNCVLNNLTSLEGGPVRVNTYDCNNNELSTLIGAPKEVNSDFTCTRNPLPQPILKLGKNILILLKYQDEYAIWSNTGVFNQMRFDMLIKDIENNKLD